MHPRLHPHISHLMHIYIFRLLVDHVHEHLRKLKTLNQAQLFQSAAVQLDTYVIWSQLISQNSGHLLTLSISMVDVYTTSIFPIFIL